MSNEISDELNTGLRACAGGMYTAEAATELLIRAFGGAMAQIGRPWIQASSTGHWIDFDAIPDHTAYTDGRYCSFADDNAARVGAHLTGRLDLAGRPVRVERTHLGWCEQRGRSHLRRLHHRRIGGRVVYRFDEEWLFTVVTPPGQPQPQCAS